MRVNAEAGSDEKRKRGAQHEGRSLHQFHHQCMFLQAVDRGDVRMIERGEHLRFGVRKGPNDRDRRGNSQSGP